MRQRALVHVSGPAGVGKTVFIERVLGARVGISLCVRAVKGGAGSRVDVERARYRSAGAHAAARYEFDEPDVEAFFTSNVMENYSEVVFVEGDSPVDFVDLAVFVAPISLEEPTILRRELREPGSARLRAIDEIVRRPGGVETIAHLFGAGPNGKVDLAGLRGRLQKSGLPTEHWALVPTYEGIQHAGLVVLNARSVAERENAALLTKDIVSLRKNPDVFRDILGIRGNKLPVTVVVADLMDPKDPGLNKAIARIKRTTKKVKP